MERFAKIVNGYFKPLIIFAKCSILDVWQGCKLPMFDIPETLQIVILRTLSNLDDGSFIGKVNCYFMLENGHLLQKSKFLRLLQKVMSDSNFWFCKMLYKKFWAYFQIVKIFWDQFAESFPLIQLCDADVMLQTLLSMVCFWYLNGTYL